VQQQKLKNHQEHGATTKTQKSPRKNTVQQQKLKKLLRIAHKNSNKTAVFKISKNFMAQDKHNKISKKIFKIHHLKSSI
jgi:hypothetical protein